VRGFKAAGQKGKGKSKKLVRRNEMEAETKGNV